MILAEGTLAGSRCRASPVNVLQLTPVHGKEKMNILLTGTLARNQSAARSFNLETETLAATEKLPWQRFSMFGRSRVMSVLFKKIFLGFRFAPFPPSGSCSECLCVIGV